jgi:hypothetical protein
MPGNKQGAPSNIPIETVKKILYVVKKAHRKELKSVQDSRDYWCKRVTEIQKDLEESQTNFVKAFMQTHPSANQIAAVCNKMPLDKFIARYIHKHGTRKMAKSVWLKLYSITKEFGFGPEWARLTKASKHAFDVEVAGFLYRSAH